jgi:hypothetical protein
MFRLGCLQQLADRLCQVWSLPSPSLATLFEYFVSALVSPDNFCTHWTVLWTMVVLSRNGRPCFPQKIALLALLIDECPETTVCHTFDIFLVAHGPDLTNPYALFRVLHHGVFRQVCLSHPCADISTLLLRHWIAVVPQPEFAVAIPRVVAKVRGLVVLVHRAFILSAVQNSLYSASASRTSCVRRIIRRTRVLLPVRSSARIQVRKAGTIWFR